MSALEHAHMVLFLREGLKHQHLLITVGIGSLHPTCKLHSCTAGDNKTNQQQTNQQVTQTAEFISTY